MSLVNFALRANTMDISPEVIGEIPDILSGFQPFLNKLSVVVGGIFGLYFILIIARVYYERKKVKILEDIRYDLDRLNIHHGVGYSAQKRRLLGRVMSFIRDYTSKKVHKDLQKMRKKKLKTNSKTKNKYKKK